MVVEFLVRDGICGGAVYAVGVILHINSGVASITVKLIRRGHVFVTVAVDIGFGRYGFDDVDYIPSMIADLVGVCMVFIP